MLEPGPAFNVLSGDNGQGKTNFLEAIYALCTLRSFRTSRLADLIAIGATEAKISGRVHTGDLDRVYELELREGGRTARLDGKTPRPLQRYFGHFNVVLFAPEDLAVVRGSPGDRRKFIDRAVFNWSPEYLVWAQDYERILRTRNQLLRDLQREKLTWAKAAPLLEVYDEQLATAGARVTCARWSFLHALRPSVLTGFDAIMSTGLELGVDYQCQEPIAEALARAGQPPEREQIQAALLSLLNERRALDRARATTSVGPHRDDLIFTLARQPAASFASQGQTRGMVLAWKTALLSLLATQRAEPPVLLLDDVSSELDPTRNQYLFRFLSGLEAQCFITTTHPDFVLLADDRVDFEVVSGRITPRMSALSKA